MGDRVDKQFYIDGKTITLYDKDHNVYGTLEVPPDSSKAPWKRPIRNLGTGDFP